MSVLLALVFTLLLAGIGIACVRVYFATRPGGHASRRAVAAPGLYQMLGRQTPLFGGRRWAIVGCYSALGCVILSLLVIDGILLFVISVARS